MRFHETWLLALAAVLVAIVAAPRPAAAQDIAIGPDFIDSQRLGAQVSGAGVLGNNVGAVGAGRVGGGVGVYEVFFNRDITGCAFKGSLGNNGFFATTGEIMLAGRAGTTTGIFVQTFDNSGVLADRDYFILVACP
jgi:hypothetical protein